ncbi:MAG: hypothetical protein ABEJ66_03895, partial [Candidatus Nanohaloarchaea archaeon]
MASAIEKSVKEATQELHARKSSEGVKVDGARDGDREMDDIEKDVEELDESSPGIFSKIKSFLGRSEEESVEAAPVEHTVPDVDYSREEPEDDAGEDETVDAPEDLGDVENLDSLSAGDIQDGDQDSGARASLGESREGAAGIAEDPGEEEDEPEHEKQLEGPAEKKKLAPESSGASIEDGPAEAGDAAKEVPESEDDVPVED